MLSKPFCASIIAELAKLPAVFETLPIQLAKPLLKPSPVKPPDASVTRDGLWILNALLIVLYTAFAIERAVAMIEPT